MAKSYQVFHLEPRVFIASGLNRHITRQHFDFVGDDRIITTWVPANADPNRTIGNQELVSREFKNSNGVICERTLQEAVDARLEEAKIKPRNGQARCLEMIFSGSHDTMVAMDRKNLLQWANDTLKWAQDTWGKENVVSAVLHVDETTPHIHMVVVPIVTGQSRRTKHQQSTAKSTRKYNINHDKLRLCMNEVYTRGKLYDYHDSYAKAVSNKYGMERGILAEPGSKKKHTDSIEHNRMLAAQVAEQTALIEELMRDYDSKKTGIQDNIQAEKNNLNLALAKTKKAEELIQLLHEDYDELQRRIENKKKTLRSLSSLGLYELIQSIPELIKNDIQDRIKKYWKGEVVSFEETTTWFNNYDEEKVVRLNIKNGERKYFIEVREKTGQVYYNGSSMPFKSKAGNVMIMSELATYFTAELSEEAKKLVESLYKKPKQHQNHQIYRGPKI